MIVPTARLAPLLAPWIAEFNAGAISDRRQLDYVYRGAYATLAERARLQPEQVRRIATERQATCHDTTADKLLCAIGRTDVWHVELADLYEEPVA